VVFQALPPVELESVVNEDLQPPSAPLFRGAGRDLGRLITTHLFVICPNNSGSTFLKNVLATSLRTWNLRREGQRALGFAGPSGVGEGTPLVWAARGEWLEPFRRPGAYDWEKIRKAWYFQAFARSEDATIFVEKSPTLLLNVEALSREFLDARFLFMVRDPYATIEGIIRRHRRRTPRIGPEEALVTATRHVVRCFDFQRHNVRRFGNAGRFFTYETMCDQPGEVERLIRGLVPALDDLTLNQRVEVKGLYDEPLRNMNHDQIQRLLPEDIEQINEFLRSEGELLDFFGYRLRDPHSRQLL
jgi:hypothetical protein